MQQAVKRIICICLILCLLISMGTTAFAVSFTDVTASTVGIEYRDAINYVTDNGIMDGTSATTFSPNAAVTRAMLVTVLYRLSGDTGTYTQASQFTDMSSSAYYYNAVGWSVANGIVSGTSSTTFSPNNTVIWQQLATFLYRYAGHMDLPQDADEDLTQAADYSSLQSYARTPMSWMYEYGIMLRSSPSANIYPNAATTRSQLALYLARFRRNVEGIVATRDRFSFRNSGTDMVSGGSTGLSEEDQLYLIGFSDWNFLLSWADQHTNASTIRELLTSNRSEGWGGSCYGFAAATVADYYGKIDINGACANNCESLYDIPSPSLTNHENNIACISSISGMQKTIWLTAAESKINMFQLSWFIPEARNWAGSISGDTGLRNLYSDLEHSGIGILCYHYGAAGTSDPSYHAVVAYGKPIATNTGFRVKIYDNRYSSSNCWLDVNTTTSTWTGTMNLTTQSGSTRTENVIDCKFSSGCSAYNSVDLVNLSTTVSLTATDNTNLEDSERTILYVIGNGAFEVANANGESFLFSNGSTTGTMEVYGIDFIPWGNGEQCVYAFLVDDSSSFTYSAANNTSLISSVCVLGESTSGFTTAADASINGLETVTISGNNNVEVVAR